MTDSKSLNVAVTENSTTKNGLISKKVITITKKNSKKHVSYEEIKQIYDHIIEKTDPKDIYIQVMAHRELTLKSLGETDFKDWDNEEYYSNRVAYVGPHLNNFAYVRICILSKGKRE